MVMIFNKANDEQGHAKLKARILCEKLLAAEITYYYDVVGTCFTVSVMENDVKKAFEL